MNYFFRGTSSPFPILVVHVDVPHSATLYTIVCMQSLSEEKKAFDRIVFFTGSVSLCICCSVKTCQRKIEGDSVAEWLGRLP